MSSATPGAHIGLRPLTERILARLPVRASFGSAPGRSCRGSTPGPNVLLDTGETSAVWEQSRTFVVLNYAALSLAIVITVWGTGASHGTWRPWRAPSRTRSSRTRAATPGGGSRRSRSRASTAGDLAFMGLWMHLAWLVPILLTGLPDVVGVVLGALVLGGGLAAFVLSLRRLHRQMLAVKTAELATARRLYAEA